MPGNGRYWFPLDGSLFTRESRFYLHWDDDQDTSRDIIIELLAVDVDSEGAVSVLSITRELSVSVREPRHRQVLMLHGA